MLSIRSTLARVDRSVFPADVVRAVLLSMPAPSGMVDAIDAQASARSWSRHSSRPQRKGARSYLAN